ncbi:MAG: heavy metal-responsive transcriptional regulator [Candidatus Deferrimicrobiaceae bacterium]
MALTIGQIAKQCEIGVETIRFYERKGLIPAPPRRDSGYRQFPPETIARIHFIQRAKELGFSLTEIRGILSLRVNRTTSCGEVKRRAELKISEIREKKKTLERMEKALARMTAACRGRGPTGQCPILEALEDEKG